MYSTKWLNNYLTLPTVFCTFGEEEVSVSKIMVDLMLTATEELKERKGSGGEPASTRKEKEKGDSWTIEKRVSRVQSGSEPLKVLTVLPKLQQGFQNNEVQSCPKVLHRVSERASQWRDTYELIYTEAKKYILLHFSFRGLITWRCNWTSRKLQRVTVCEGLNDCPERERRAQWWPSLLSKLHQRTSQKNKRMGSKRMRRSRGKQTRGKSWRRRRKKRQRVMQSIRHWSEPSFASPRPNPTSLNHPHESQGWQTLQPSSMNCSWLARLLFDLGHLW